MKQQDEDEVVDSSEIQPYKVRANKSPRCTCRPLANIVLNIRCLNVQTLIIPLFLLNCWLEGVGGDGGREGGYQPQNNVTCWLLTTSTKAGQQFRQCNTNLRGIEKCQGRCHLLSNNEKCHSNAKIEVESKTKKKNKKNKRPLISRVMSSLRALCHMT